MVRLVVVRLGKADWSKHGADAAILPAGRHLGQAGARLPLSICRLQATRTMYVRYYTTQASHYSVPTCRVPSSHALYSPALPDVRVNIGMGRGIEAKRPSS